MNNFNPVEVAQVADRQQEEEKRIETLKTIKSYLIDLKERIEYTYTKGVEKTFRQTPEKMLKQSLMLILHNNLLENTTDPNLKTLYENIDYDELFKNVYSKNLNAQEFEKFLSESIEEIERMIQNKNKIIVPEGSPTPPSR